MGTLLLIVLLGILHFFWKFLEKDFYKYRTSIVGKNIYYGSQ